MSEGRGSPGGAADDNEDDQIVSGSSDEEDENRSAADFGAGVEERPPEVVVVVLRQFAGEPPAAPLHEEEEEEDSVSEERQSSSSSAASVDVEETAENDMNKVKAKVFGSKRTKTAGAGSSSTQDIGGKVNAEQRRITFDRDLPAAHTYLGSDLEDVGGGLSLEEEGSVINGVALLPLPNVVLMPGQTLPLQSLHPRLVSIFRRHRLFAVVNVRTVDVTDGEEEEEEENEGRDVVIRGRRRLREQMASLATLAQVVAYKEEEEDQLTMLKLRAVGRQRCRVLESTRQIDGTLTGKLRILTDVCLPEPLANPSCIFGGASLTDPSGDGVWSCCFPSMVRITKNMKRPSSAKLSKYYGSVVTPLPWFVYKIYDINSVVFEMVSDLSCWYDSEKVRLLSENRVDFSYWVAANLPVDDERKLELLGIDCCLRRLCRESALLKKCVRFCCGGCLSAFGSSEVRPVLSKTDVFSLSLEGPIGAYVNIGGYVHEMMTAHKVKGVRTVGSSSTEQSWFPGYAWTILECERCRRHMGWKFTAVKKQLKPSKFWGITRSAIRPLLIQQSQTAATSLESTNDDDDL